MEMLKSYWKVVAFSTSVRREKCFPLYQPEVQQHNSINSVIIQGGPIKTVHFLRYHIFAANTEYNHAVFLLKCSEITAENNKRQFLNECLDVQLFTFLHQTTNIHEQDTVRTNNIYYSYSYGFRYRLQDLLSCKHLMSISVHTSI